MNIRVIILLLSFMFLIDTGIGFSREHDIYYGQTVEVDEEEKLFSDQEEDHFVTAIDDNIFIQAEQNEGWEVKTSHTFSVRDNITIAGKSHEVGFDVRITSNPGYLLPPPDYPRASPYSNTVFMGSGAGTDVDLDWEIINVIVPDDPEVSYEINMLTELPDLGNVQYKRSGINQSYPVSAQLIIHEMTSVTLETRNTAGADLAEIDLVDLEEELGINIFNASVNLDLECDSEEDPSEVVPRTEPLNARLTYHWGDLLSYSPVGWKRSNNSGSVQFDLGGSNNIDFGAVRVTAPALYMRAKHYITLDYTYVDLETFEGKVKVIVRCPNGDPFPNSEIRLWGGMSRGSGQASARTDENGEAELQYPRNTSGTDKATINVTAFPRIGLWWMETQVVDAPQYIVRDHSQPFFLSPFVWVGGAYQSSQEVDGIILQVYDVGKPNDVIAETMPSSYKKYDNYTNQDRVILAKHRAYIQIDPQTLFDKQLGLGIRAVFSNTDHGRRTDEVIVGDEQYYNPERILYEAKKTFNFRFQPLAVGAWESGNISYGSLDNQKEFIRNVFPAPVEFNDWSGFPRRITRANWFGWREESHNSYLRRIFRQLEREQKVTQSSDNLDSVDLIIGLTPPGFLGASGLQDGGTFGMNWEFFGAAHGAVLIDPSQVIPHTTIHEFLHTLGLRDVYPSSLTNRRPMSASGHDGNLPINNVQSYSAPYYTYFDPLHEAIMFDWASSPWPTHNEYTTMLNYAVQASQAEASSLMTSQSSSPEKSKQVLLITGEVEKFVGGQPQSVDLDPVIAYHGLVDRGGVMSDNPYVVQLVADDGAILEQGFFSSFEYDGNQLASFLLTLPWHDQVAAVEIGRHSDGELTSLWERYDYNKDAPTVSITGPQEKTLTGDFEITWEVTNTDGSAVNSTLLASPDNGDNWQMIDMDLFHAKPGLLSYGANSSDFPAGDNYRFKVIVSDGLLSSEAVSPSTYIMDGYSLQPVLELEQTEIVVEVTQGVENAAAIFPISNAGNEQLVVQFEVDSLPEWISPSFDGKSITIDSGSKKVIVIPLLLPAEGSETDLEVDLALQTNDPDQLESAVNVKVKYVEEPPAPDLAAFITSPAGLPGGHLPLETPVAISAYASAGRSDLEAAITIEAAGKVIVKEDLMDLSPHEQGLYIYRWNPVNSDASAGEYGVRIILTDSSNDLTRDNKDYDFRFTLYDNTTKKEPVFTEPETSRNELDPVKIGETVVIPYSVSDPDGDELSVEVHGPLVEHGLELVKHDNNSGELRWNANLEGIHYVYLSATNTQGFRAETVFRIPVGENLSIVTMRVYLNDQLPDPGVNPGTISPAEGYHVFSTNTPITITARPAEGYEFVKWQSAYGNATFANAYDPSTTVTLKGNDTVQAIFSNGSAIGSQPIASLNIGDLVVDPSWEWQSRLQNHYSGDGPTKSVTWIVVAKDHYDVDGNQPHVTLLSKEVIARHAYDNSTNRGHQWDDYGSSHWGDSGKPDAEYGLRPFLNSIDKEDGYAYAGSGFYNAFSDSFKNALLKTSLPNAVWDTGAAYNTSDYVFALSMHELGFTHQKHKIGDILPYFDLPDEERTELEQRRHAVLPGYDQSLFYWTRSPAYDTAGYYVNVISAGGTGLGTPATQAAMVSHGVRPALNLKSNVLVTESANADGAYEILGGTGAQSVGLYDPADGVFHLDGKNPYRFGPRGSSWLSLAGNWKGDGISVGGLYDPGDGVFHLQGETPFRYGPRNSVWLSVSGNWDRESISKIGLYDPADGVFHLQGEVPFRYGPRNSNWLPVSGDWDGNGTSSVGLYDPSDGVFHLSGRTPFRFGPRNSDWLPVAGDWNGDGSCNIGLYDSSDGVFHLQGETPFRFGPRSSKWKPLAGRW